MERAFSLWNLETREIGPTGIVSGEKKDIPEGWAVFYGAEIDRDTHVMGEDGLPVPRSTPKPMTEVEFSIAVNRERQRRLEAGKDFGGVWVTGSDREQVLLLALKDTARDLIADGDIQPAIPYRDALNVEHLLTAPKFIEIADAGKAYVSEIYMASWKIKAMATSTDFTSDNLWPSRQSS